MQDSALSSEYSLKYLADPKPIKKKKKFMALLLGSSGATIFGHEHTSGYYILMIFPTFGI